MHLDGDLFWLLLLLPHLKNTKKMLGWLGQTFDSQWIWDP